MGADIGYLQTKINELNDKVNLQNKSIEELQTAFINVAKIGIEKREQFDKLYNFYLNCEKPTVVVNLDEQLIKQLGQRIWDEKLIKLIHNLNKENSKEIQNTQKLLKEEILKSNLNFHKAMIEKNEKDFIALKQLIDELILFKNKIKKDVVLND